jgi:antitoxin (DNA-binding transcriptional repressor) of toxin-antitoxin stability system
MLRPEHDTDCEVTTSDYLAVMKVVGVKQLKARLSEYLRDVRRGEVFLVTDRDVVVAELRPASSDVIPPIDDAEHSLRLLAESGDVTPPRLPRGEWRWRPEGLNLDPDRVAAILDELRSDRNAL